MKRPIIKIISALSAIFIILLTFIVGASAFYVPSSNQTIAIYEQTSYLWSGVYLNNAWESIAKSCINSRTSPSNSNWSVTDFYSGEVVATPLMLEVNSADPYITTTNMPYENAVYSKVYAVVYCTNFTANTTLTGFLTFDGATDVNTLINVEIIADGTFHIAYFDFRAWYDPQSYNDMVDKGIRNGFRLDLPEYNYNGQTVNYDFNILMISAYDSLQSAWKAWNYMDSTSVGGNQAITDDMMQGAVNEGYNQGYNDGSQQAGDKGYNQGYSDGYDTGKQQANSDMYNSGYEAGKLEGSVNGYNDGYRDGLSEHENDYSAGYDDGYEQGKQSGYIEGFNKGAEGNNFWMDLFNAIANTPINIITSLFNFEVFGINLLSIVLAIITFFVAIWVVKKVV